MNPPQIPLKIICIGDICTDEYRYGTVDRISPEAPVPVFCPTSIDKKDGMVANVFNNLVAFGLEARMYYSDRSTKIRLIDQKSNQHLLRIDHDAECQPIDIKNIDTSDADAIIISDYDKGSVTYELIEQIVASATAPVFVDTKKTDLVRLGNCFLKINELEYSRRTSDGINMIVTHGGSHVQYKDARFKVPKVPVFDVCGAGDTFLASLVYQYLVSNNMNIAIKFAIRASSVTVQHSGVYAPTLMEIL